jgi:predicted RNase H-like HicB family nuclease
MSEETVSTGCARIGKTVKEAFGKLKAIEVLVEDLVYGRRD